MGASATLRRMMAQDPVLTACGVLTAIGNELCSTLFGIASFGVLFCSLFASRNSNSEFVENFVAND